MKDYYVAMALRYVGQTDFPEKQFFWCSSTTWVFAQMPKVQDEQKQNFDQMKTFFSGEFDRVLIESNEPPKVIDAEEGIVLPPKHITELDRLAYVVNEIEKDC